MSRLTKVWWLAVLGAAAGCDRQVDHDFQGDPLLQITGSVTVPLGLEHSELVPALVFFASSADNQHVCGHKNDVLQVLEVGVQGQFPSRFTLDVFDPPPEDAMERAEDGAFFAVGYVAAVSPDHPDAFRVYPPDEDGYLAWRDLEIAECGQYALDRAQGGHEGCIVMHSCTLDAKRCMHRTVLCSLEATQVSYNDCEVSRSDGDPAVAIAGYSVNYSVLYLPEAAAAGSPLAQTWAAGEAIAAGYHLYHHPKVGIRMDRELFDCLPAAMDRALDRYNEEHDTDPEIDPLMPQQASDLPAFSDFQCVLQQVITEQCDPIVEGTSEEVGDEPIAIELGTVAPKSFTP